MRKSLGSCTIKHIAKIFSLYLYDEQYCIIIVINVQFFTIILYTTNMKKNVPLVFINLPIAKNSSHALNGSVEYLLHNTFVSNSNYSNHRIPEIDVSIENAIKILDAIHFDCL